MTVNKPEQASTEMTKVLKSIADTIDGKSNTDCAATSEISKWTKYVGNKLAQNSSSGGGSGTEIVKLHLRYNSDGNAIYFTDMNRQYISENNFLSIVNDETKLVLVSLDSDISVMFNALSPIVSFNSTSSLMTMKRVCRGSSGWVETVTSVAVSSSGSSNYTKTNLSYAAEQV